MKRTKLLPMPCTVLIACAATLLAAPVAQAAGSQASTMILSSELFPSGAAAPDGPSGTIPTTPHGAGRITAPRYLYVPGTSSAPPAVYEFIFWNIGDHLVRHPAASYIAPGPSTTWQASAWYIPVGGGPCVSPPCLPDATTWAFSLTDHKVLSQSPISAVTPAAAWTSGTTSVSTTDAAALSAGHVAITAAPKLSLSPPLPPTGLGGYYQFDQWFQFAGNGKVHGSVLRVPASGGSDAIAFYRLIPRIVVPHCGTPPCPPPM